MHREVILKVRRTIFPHDVTMHASGSHSSFLTWIKVVFRDGRRLAHLLGQCRTTPATWSTPRRGACSVPRDHPTPAPDSPARRQAAEVKMVGYITIAHGTAQRLSEKWRHCACTSVVITFCTSPFCVGVERHLAGAWAGGRREMAPFRALLASRRLSSWRECRFLLTPAAKNFLRRPFLCHWD